MASPTPNPIFRFFSAPRNAMPHLASGPPAGSILLEEGAATHTPVPNVLQRPTTLNGAGMSVDFFGTRAAVMETAGWQEASAFHHDGILGNVGPDRLVRKSSSAHVQQQLEHGLDDHGDHLLQTPRFFDERILVAADLHTGTGAKQFGMMPQRRLFHFLHDQPPSRRNLYTMVDPSLPLDLYFDIDGKFVDAAERDYWAGILLPAGSNPATLPGSQANYNPLRLACDHVVITIISAILSGILSRLPSPATVIEQVAVFDSCKLPAPVSPLAPADTAATAAAVPQQKELLPEHKISFHVHIRLWDGAAGRPMMFCNVAAVKAFVATLMDDFRAESARREQQQESGKNAGPAAAERRNRDEGAGTGKFDNEEEEDGPKSGATSPYDYLRSSPRLWLHFIDTVVYTAWRPFRLPFCSKRGAIHQRNGTTLLPRCSVTDQNSTAQVLRNGGGNNRSNAPASVASLLSGADRVSLEQFLQDLRCTHAQNFRIVMSTSSHRHHHVPTDLLASNANNNNNNNKDNNNNKENAAASGDDDDDAKNNNGNDRSVQQSNVREHITHEMQRVFHDTSGALIQDATTTTTDAAGLVPATGAQDAQHHHHHHQQQHQHEAGFRMMSNLVFTSAREAVSVGDAIQFPIVISSPEAAGYLWLAMSMSIIVRPEYKQRLGFVPLPATMVAHENFVASPFDPVLLALAQEDCAQQRKQAAAAGSSGEAAADKKKLDDKDSQKEQQQSMTISDDGSVTTVDGQRVQLHPKSLATGGRWNMPINTLPEGSKLNVESNSVAYRIILAMFRAIAPQFAQSVTRLSGLKYTDSGFIRGYYAYQKMSKWCPKLQRAHASSYVGLYVTYGSIKIRCYSNDCGNQPCMQVPFIPDSQTEPAVPLEKEPLRTKYRDIIFPDWGRDVVLRKYAPRTVSGDVLERSDSGWSLVDSGGLAASTSAEMLLPDDDFFALLENNNKQLLLEGEGEEEEWAAEEAHERIPLLGAASLSPSVAAVSDAENLVAAATTTTETK